MNKIKSALRPWHFTLLFTAFLLSAPSVSSAQVVVKRNTVRVQPAPRVVTPVRRGTVVRVAPRGAQAVPFGSVSYRYYGGVFYKPCPSGFVVVAPPAGIRISLLPVGHTVVVVRGRPYYHYRGTYYVAAGRGYKVVATPV